jgi:hypothetical protein
MKHGDKAKAKAAKTKASGKEAGSKASATTKGGKAVKAAGKKESSSTKAVPSKKSSGVKAAPQAAGKTSASGRSNGKVARSEPEAITFTNPTIEDAFKRAIKKYPNTFRRLSD